MSNTLKAAHKVHWTCRHGVSHYGEKFCSMCLTSALTNEGRGQRGKDKQPRKRKAAA